MSRVKVWCMYSLYAVLFAVVFVIMLVLLTAAAVGVPAGLVFSVFGAAVMLFEADFVITQLSPTLMLFGGLRASFASALCGLIAVRVGFMISSLFLRIKRRCDKLRGW